MKGYILDCIKKIVGVGAAVQVIAWWLSCGDDVKKLILEYRSLVIATICFFLFINFIFYDSRIKLEKIEYEKKRKKVPTHRRKSKKSKK